MRHNFLIFTIFTCLLLLACTSISAQEAGSITRRPRTSATTSRLVSIEGRKVAEQVLVRLRVLRDGWNDVNRQFIKQDFVAARRLDSREYEVQYLEAKEAVMDALRILPKSELRTAVERAMEIFDDLEVITNIFNKNSPITTSVRVTDIFPYLKKYDIPYENGVTRVSYGLTLHQDFVMSYLLPLRYARVNRVEVLLGGRKEPVPSPPTYEKMFRVPPAPTRPNVGVEELKEITRQAIEARLRGNRSRMGALLDAMFTFHGLRGLELNKEQYLERLASDPSVRRFEFEQVDLSFRQGVPVLATEIKYESHTGKFRSFKNTFIFIKRENTWLVSSWRAF